MRLGWLDWLSWLGKEQGSEVEAGHRPIPEPEDPSEKDGWQLRLCWRD